MRLWQKLWLLFTVIWVVVAALQVGTLLAFSPDEREKAWQPALLGVLVPAVLYAILWLTSRWRSRPRAK